MRSWIVDYKLEEQKPSILGGKGLNLFRLKQLGAPVPEFGIVSTIAYQEWLESDKVLSENLIQAIKASALSWNTNYFAVRSSMTAEDGSAHSYAGMMESYLFVTIDDLPEMICRCFESMSTDRVKAYESTVAQGTKSQHAAVVVQKMVEAKMSGVAFSRAPMGDSSLIHIEAGLGLGEGIVSGLVEIDTIQVDRFLRVTKHSVQAKTKAVVFDYKATSGARVKEVANDPELAARPALSSNEIHELSSMVLKLERAMGYPVDIEWSFANRPAGSPGHVLYLLQIRPVTQTFPKLTYFIDTNLSESYPGLTTPMTAAFVRHGYTKAFVEAFEYLNVSAQRLKDLAPYLKNLVINLGGHMYYNLTSYYSVLSSMPGGQGNIERWHHMIGGSIESGSQVLPVPPLSKKESLKSYAALLRMYLMHDKIFAGFSSYTTANRSELIHRLAKAKTAQEVAGLMDFALKTTRGFGLTALNDFLIMIVMKLLLTLLKSNGISEQELPALVKTETGVESLKPLHDLEELVNSIPDQPRFYALFRQFVIEHGQDEWELEALYERFYKFLALNGYSDSAGRIKKYLSLWGQRSFEELKLESLTLKQSPALLLKLMEFMASQGQRSQSHLKRHESFDLSRLSMLSRPVAKLLLYYAHKTIAMREKTRLIRGQYFGIVRDSILRFASLLRIEQKALFAHYSVSEFFGLSFDSVIAYAEQKKKVEDLAEELSTYCAQRSTRKDFPEMLCLEEGSTSPSLPDDQAELMSEAPANGSIKGLGAARGKVQGIVLRLESPDEALSETNLRERILVTRTTDPAWVFIMSQCKGLVSEKGSLLSHTAIIGREMGIPTVVGVARAMTLFKSGDHIEIDGESGLISKIGQEAEG